MDHDRLLFVHASRQSYFSHRWDLSSNSWKFVIFLAKNIGHSDPLRVEAGVSLVLFWYGGTSCCTLPGSAVTIQSQGKQDCRATLNDWNCVTYKFAINNTTHVSPRFRVMSLYFVRSCTLYWWRQIYFIVLAKMFELQNFQKDRQFT
jgi:hypothetical protein